MNTTTMPTVMCYRCECAITRGYAHVCRPIISTAAEARRAYILGLVRNR